LEALGKVLVAHDQADLGRGRYKAGEVYGHPAHPSPIHHWQAGVLMDWFGKWLQAVAAKKLEVSK
jgi:hypothetical protein